MENFTRRVAGWFLLCLAMSMSLSAAAQQPPVERVDVETIPVQDDLEEMVIESQPESTNHPKQEKDVDTDDDDRAAAVRTDAGQDENVGQASFRRRTGGVTRATVVRTTMRMMTKMRMMTRTKESEFRLISKFRQLREHKRRRKRLHP